MIGFEEDYQQIEENHKYFPIIYGEWIFFAFGLEPNSYLDNYLSKLANIPKDSQSLFTKPCQKERDNMRKFAIELLESGETIFIMSEKYRNINNGGFY